MKNRLQILYKYKSGKEINKQMSTDSFSRNRRKSVRFFLITIFIHYIQINRKHGCIESYLQSISKLSPRKLPT